MSDPDVPVRPDATSRRTFASALAAAAGAPLLARALPLAGQAAPAPAPSPSPTAAPPPAALEPTMQLVRAKYGQHLTPERMEDVRQSVQRSILNADRMSRLPLANSDEPDVVYFAALPGLAGIR
jgi:hypothetical protein